MTVQLLSATDHFLRAPHPAILASVVAMLASVETPEHASQKVSMDQSLRVMTRYNELWKPSGLDRAEHVIAPQFVRYGSSGQFRGVPAFKRYVTHYLSAFPDLKFAVEDWLAHSGKLVIHYSFTGTHDRAFMGVAATGRWIRAEGAAIYHVTDGKLVELWDFLDLFGIAEQLGAHLQSFNPALSWK